MYRPLALYMQYYFYHKSQPPYLSSSKDKCGLTALNINCSYPRLVHSAPTTLWYTEPKTRSSSLRLSVRQRPVLGRMQMVKMRKQLLAESSAFIQFFFSILRVENSWVVKIPFHFTHAYQCKRILTTQLFSMQRILRSHPSSVPELVLLLP